MSRRGRWRNVRNRGGTSAKRAMRFRLCEAQNWRCAYCGCALEPETATIEHAMPLSWGGAHAWENLIAACEPCNRMRGHLVARMMLMVKGCGR